MNDKRASDEPPAGTPADGGYWFTPMPIYLLEATFDPNSPVNGPAAMLWAHLHRNYAWRKRVFPSYATLGRETGQSESAVKRQLGSLKEVGAIHWGANYGPKGRSSNEYALAPHRPFEFDRGIGPAVEVKNELHRRAEVRNDLGVEVISDRHPQVKNDLVVENTVELETTTTSAPADPSARPATEGGGGGQRQGEQPDRPGQPIDSAETFLQSLPGPWAAGRKTARELAPLLLERIAQQGWRLDDDLTRRLSRDLGPVRTTHASVLRARIDDLPKKPSTKSRDSPNDRPMPPWCEHRNCDEITRRRTTEDHEGHRSSSNCRTCHPDHYEDQAA